MMPLGATSRGPAWPRCTKMTLPAASATAARGRKATDAVAGTLSGPEGMPGSFPDVPVPATTTIGSAPVTAPAGAAAAASAAAARAPIRVCGRPSLW